MVHLEQALKSIDHMWKKNFKQVKDREMQVTVYHNLRVLLEATDQQKFELHHQRQQVLVTTSKHIMLKIKNSKQLVIARRLL